MKGNDIYCLFIDIVNFNHKYGCQQCLVEGEYNRTSRRMSFPMIEAQQRTDDMFRNRDQAAHHKEAKSLMEELPFDMIKSFPTSDPLHLLHLGVMRKCIYRWIYGDKGYKRKWNKVLVEKISSLLCECNPFMPSDIHRSIRALKNVKYWKGLEFRTVLLYVGIVVLKEALNEDEYIHFLILSCAARLCSCSFYRKYLNAANIMFRTYVQKYIELYGSDTISSNVHNLLHIVDDLRQIDDGNLETISTYKFENSLRMLGLKLKSCNLPLEQIARRITEANQVEKSCELEHEQFSPYVQSDFEYEGLTAYKKCFIKPDVMLSANKYGDQWFQTRSNEIVKMKCAIKCGNDFKIVGNQLKSKIDFFSTPIKSEILDIFTSNGDLEVQCCQYNLNEIKAKLICLKYDHNIVTMPLLHCLDILNK